MSNEEELIRLLSLSETDLFKEGGSSVPNAVVLGAAPKSEPPNEEKFERWLTENREKICRAIANSARVRSIIEDSDESNQVELAAACTDALTIAFSGIPVAIVAVVIVRRGIGQVCRRELRK